ncbi:hypothetical protein FY048_17910 [Acinetobacter sp. 1124_18A]|uniref:hypothetical protein n=1 Tax=Acinetobacter sp. 1124_18A TaxID=2605958 RepID=UPI004058A042
MTKFLIGLMFCLVGSYLYAKDSIPRYSDYPVKSLYTGGAAKLDLSDSDAKLFRTRLSEALKRNPDFAGEYVTAMWGCGASCRSYSFVNKRTGKLLKDGFGGEERQEDLLETNPRSRLLVTQEEKMNNDYEVESITQRFYILENGKFKLIKTIENIKPE